MVSLVIFMGRKPEVCWGCKELKKDSVKSFCPKENIGVMNDVAKSQRLCEFEKVTE